MYSYQGTVFGDQKKREVKVKIVAFEKAALAYHPRARRQAAEYAAHHLALYCDLGRGSLDDTYTWNYYGRPSINTTMAVGNLVQEE